MTYGHVPIFYVGLRPATARPSAFSKASYDVAKVRHLLTRAQSELGQVDAMIAQQNYTDAELHIRRGTLQDIINDYQIKLAEARRIEANTPAPPPPSPPEDNDQEITDISERVLSFSYEDDEKKTDLVKLTIDNEDLSMFDSGLLEKDAVLIVSWGYLGNLAPPREAVVQSVKGALRLTVEAQDKGVLMHKLTRSRVFDQKSRADVVAEIAQEHGYGKDRRFIQDDGVIRESISQAAQTDAQFLKKLADQEGFEFYVGPDGLHWHERRLDQEPARVLQYYLPPEVGEVMSFSIDNDINAKPGKVAVRGRDPVAKKNVEEVADDSTTSRVTLSAEPEIVGSNALSPVEVFNERTLTSHIEYRRSEQPGKAPQPAATGSMDVRPTTETDAKAAKREAGALFKRAQQSAISLSLKVIGDPNLAAKSIVDVRGLGKRFSGKYYVASAKHDISSSGYVLSLKTKTEGTNKRSSKRGSTGKKPDTAASQNTKNKVESEGSGVDAPPLSPVEVFDERTLESHIEYRDTRGQDSAQPPRDK